MMLVDRENRRGAAVIFCETEDDLRRVDQAMNEMSPPARRRRLRAVPANDSHVAQRVHVLLAEWVLDRLASERVPQLAVEALEQGCEALSIALLAGLDSPTQADIEDLMPRLFATSAESDPHRH